MDHPLLPRLRAKSSRTVYKNSPLSSMGEEGADSIGEKGEEKKKHSSEQLKEKLRRRRKKPDGQSQTLSAPVRKSSLALNTGQNLNADVSGPNDRLEGVSHLRWLTKTENWKFL